MEFYRTIFLFGFLAKACERIYMMNYSCIITHFTKLLSHKYQATIHKQLFKVIEIILLIRIFDQ